MQRRIRKCENKECYRGLTYRYMEDYISSHGTEADMLAYKEKRLISECHSKAFRYPAIKKWFLQTYPEIALFGVDGVTDEKQDAPALEVLKTA